MKFNVVVDLDVFLNALNHMDSWKEIATEATFVPWTGGEWQEIFTFIAMRDKPGLIKCVETHINWRKLNAPTEPPEEFIVR